MLPEHFVVKNLRVWATAAKSAWEFHKATFQKPRGFCPTGYYAMSGVDARIVNDSSTALALTSAPRPCVLLLECQWEGRLGLSATGRVSRQCLHARDQYLVCSIP